MIRESREEATAELAGTRYLSRVPVRPRRALRARALRTADSPLAPQSPYARTKAVCEEMFADIAVAGPRVLSLRYFNSVGADPELRTGLEPKRPSHALGVLIQAHQEGRPFPIRGTNYPTRERTGIRDYVHVWGLAAAHVAAINRFDSILTESKRSIAINLGTGAGTTVRELCAAFSNVVSTPSATVDTGPRPGDVAGGYTKSDRAAELPGWVSKVSLEEGTPSAPSLFRGAHTDGKRESRDSSCRRGQATRCPTGVLLGRPGMRVADRSSPDRRASRAPLRPGPFPLGAVSGSGTGV
ncbi:NAD-dependent epimerase/dehydratase family protein [Streptomyces sp. NPDC001135]